MILGTLPGMMPGISIQSQKSSSTPSCPCVSIRAVCFQRRVVLCHHQPWAAAADHPTATATSKRVLTKGLLVQVIHNQSKTPSHSFMTDFCKSLCLRRETHDLLEHKGNFGLKFRHQVPRLSYLFTYRSSYILGVAGLGRHQRTMSITIYSFF